MEELKFREVIQGYMNAMHSLDKTDEDWCNIPPEEFLRHFDADEESLTLSIVQVVSYSVSAYPEHAKALYNLDKMEDAAKLIRENWT